jgi:integrase
MMARNAALTNIEVRTAKDGSKSYRATIYDKRAKKYRRSSWSPLLGAAKSDRNSLLSLIEAGMLGDTDLTLCGATEVFMRGAEGGSIRNRSGDVFKPSVLASYRSSLDLHVLPVLGDKRLDTIRRKDIQTLVDRMMTHYKPSTVHNMVNPLRTIYRWAESADLLTLDPTVNLKLPAVRSERKISLDPKTVKAMIAALPSVYDRALWAAAFYSGLRAGELAALTWGDVTADSIEVRRSYDRRSKVDVLPKSRAGIRDVPMVPDLKAALAAMPSKLLGGLIFRGQRGGRLVPNSVYTRSRGAWQGTYPVLSLHQARHVAVSLWIASGIDAKACQTYAGHSSISTTLDIYTSLQPDHAESNVAKFAALLAA